VSGFTKQTGERCAILAAYAQHRFSDVAAPVYMPLAATWLVVLQEAAESKERSSATYRMGESVTRWSWLFFELIIKSLTLQIQEKGCLDLAHEQEFVGHMEDVLTLFSRRIYRHRSHGQTALKKLVQNLALFFGDLYCALPLPHANHLVRSFDRQFRSTHRDPVLVDFKCVQGLHCPTMGMGMGMTTVGDGTRRRWWQRWRRWGDQADDRDRSSAAAFTIANPPAFVHSPLMCTPHRRPLSIPSFPPRYRPPSHLTP